MGCCGSSHNHKNSHNHSNNNSNLTPIELLKIRLANGEITLEEYLKIKNELTN